MVGWRHRLDGKEFEQSLGDGGGQGGLASCGPWGRKGSDTTEPLNHHHRPDGPRLGGGLLLSVN